MFKGLRNRVTKDCCTLKSNYYIHILSEAKEKGNIIWKQVNSLIKPKSKAQDKYILKVGDEIVHDSKRIVNIFNDFIQSVKDLASIFFFFKLKLMKDEDSNQFENIEDNVKLFEIQEVDQSVIKIIINE